MAYFLCCLCLCFALGPGHVELQCLGCLLVSMSGFVFVGLLFHSLVVIEDSANSGSGVPGKVCMCLYWKASDIKEWRWGSRKD